MKMLATMFASALLLALVPAGSNLNLGSTLIATGGGAGSYSTIRAFDRMVGPDTVLTNENKIAAQYGQTNVNQFIRMFDYAISDAWKVAGEDNVSMPPPGQLSGQALATALVQAGMQQGGTFDIDHLFSQLFGAKVASQVMTDLNVRFGAGSSGNFARMADQFFTNIGQTVGVNVE
ncbi:MAG TPA: hypothetical protein VMF11_01330 [Candidatus Baltobacteraceae bacterium]|nr:hypothetical protein [Candidatus Baltobacteraceae bacterium]